MSLNIASWKNKSMKCRHARAWNSFINNQAAMAICNSILPHKHDMQWFKLSLVIKRERLTYCSIRYSPNAHYFTFPLLFIFFSTSFHFIKSTLEWNKVIFYFKIDSLATHWSFTIFKMSGCRWSSGLRIHKRHLWIYGTFSTSVNNKM